MTNFSRWWLFSFFQHKPAGQLNGIFRADDGRGAP